MFIGCCYFLTPQLRGVSHHPLPSTAAWPGRARGASATEVMLAGNWRTARMVAHYSAGATAERGAVAKYL